MVGLDTPPAATGWDTGEVAGRERRDRGEAGSFRQVYSTTLLDFDGGRAIEWAYVPAALLKEWDEPDLDRTLQALGLQMLVELPSLSALPAAIVAMVESADSPDQAGGRLDELLHTTLGTWSNAVDSAVLTFAQFAAFSAVLPVEWTPLEKVPVPDAVIGAAAAGGAAAGPAAGALAITAGVHSVAVIALIGVGGVALGAVALPIAAIGGAALAWKLLGPKFAGGT